MTRPPLTDEHLRAALRAQADEVHPDEDGSLATIRRRGHAAKVRRRAVLGGTLALVVVAVGALVIPRLGEDPSRVDVINPPETTTTEPAPETTTTTPEPAAPAVFQWPPAGHPQYDDPREAAAAFVEEFIGLADPALGETMEEEPHQVQIEVLGQREDGSVFEGQTRSTLHLAQFADGMWRVELAQSDELFVDQLTVAQSAAAIIVQGRGRGFEGTVIVQARAVDSSSGDFLAQEVTIAGSAAELAPFEVTLGLSRPPALTDAVVLFNDSGVEAVADFTVYPVAYAGDLGEAPVEIYLVGPEGEVVAVERRVQPPALLNGALNALLEGPAPIEQADGYTTALPPAEPGLEITATITDGVAHVDIPFELTLGPGDSGGQTLSADDGVRVVEQLTSTVFQFENIDQVEFTMSGSCEDFLAWTGAGDCLWSRGG